MKSEKKYKLLLKIVFEIQWLVEAKTNQLFFSIGKNNLIKHLFFLFNPQTFQAQFSLIMLTVQHFLDFWNIANNPPERKT